MIDKKLLSLLGGNRKYIFYTVALMVLGMLASVTVTASLCKAISLAAEYNVNSGGPIIFLSPALAAVAGILVRYAASVLSGNLKDALGRRAKKELRQQVYDKVVRLGVRSTDGMSMAGLTQVAMNGASAGNKILTLLAQPEPEWGKETLTGTEMRLEHVSFSYDGQRQVLKDVSMVFPEKGMTAIVGESGCGKSTAVNLLSGSFRAGSGRVTVGGKPIETLSRENFYSHLAVVSYNSFLFNDTVRANFRLANPNVTEAGMLEALQKVNLLAFIQESGGLDKQIYIPCIILAAVWLAHVVYFTLIVKTKDSVPETE